MNRKHFSEISISKKLWSRDSYINFLICRFLPFNASTDWKTRCTFYAHGSTRSRHFYAFRAADVTTVHYIIHFHGHSCYTMQMFVKLTCVFLAIDEETNRWLQVLHFLDVESRVLTPDRRQNRLTTTPEQCFHFSFATEAIWRQTVVTCVSNYRPLWYIKVVSLKEFGINGTSWSQQGWCLQSQTELSIWKINQIFMKIECFCYKYIFHEKHSMQHTARQTNVLL